MTDESAPARRVVVGVDGSEQSAGDASRVATAITSQILRDAAQRAIAAPSVHNTQPWTLVVRDDRLEIHADATRQLTVLDPRRRQLTISCGCALFHTRVAIAAAGHEAIVERLPDPTQPALIARVRVGEPDSAARIAGLDTAIDARRTNRRAYADEPVPGALVGELVAAARAEGAHLVPVTSAEHRIVVAELTELAERIEQADPRYLDELRAWITNDPRRRDGVQAATIPYAGAGAGPLDAVPLRAFDVAGMGWLPASSHSGIDQCLLVLCAEDTNRGWVRVGEALEHVWLELTRQGYWASPLTQLVEVAVSNHSLHRRLGLLTPPQLLLRVGRAPDVAHTPRRDPDDVIVDATTAGARRG